MGWVSICGGDVNPRPPYTPPGGGGGTGLFPNQPAGWTQYENNSWNVAPATFPTINASGFYNRDTADQVNLSIVTDATAPASPSNVFQGKLPLNWGGGSSTYAIIRPLNSSTERFSKMYCGVYMKLSSNFTNNGNSGTKYFWPNADSSDPEGASATYTGFDGTNLEFQFFQQNSPGGSAAPDRRLGATQNATSAQFDTKLGTWHLIEFIIEANSAQGTADGTLTVWVDNIKTHDYRPALANGVDWYMTGTPRQWVGFRHEDTYGGGPNPEPFDMFMYMDHLRLAGI